MANLGRFVARRAHLCVLATAAVGTAWGSWLYLAGSDERGCGDATVELARSVDTFS